jgi:hypothetical protein
VSGDNVTSGAIWVDASAAAIVTTTSTAGRSMRSSMSASCRSDQFAESVARQIPSQCPLISAAPARRGRSVGDIKGPYRWATGSGTRSGSSLALHTALDSRAPELYRKGDLRRVRTIAYPAGRRSGSGGIAMSSSISYPTLSCESGRPPGSALREAGCAEAPKPRLLDRVRAALRLRHYSRRTEEAYVAWIRRYILFHRKRHPADMGAPELTAFLSSLAVDGRVAASTQNQALSALLFLYREVLELDVPWLDGIVRAKRPLRLPVVLTREEVLAVLRPLRGVPRLMRPYSMGLDSACSSAAACASRTSTSRRIRSWCEPPRATKTG